MVALSRVYQISEDIVIPAGTMVGIKHLPFGDCWSVEANIIAGKALRFDPPENMKAALFEAAGLV